MPPFKKPKIEISEDETTGVKKAKIGQKEFPAIAFAPGSKMEFKSSENDGLTTLLIDGKPVADGFACQVNEEIYFVPINDLAEQTEEKRSETFKSLSLYSKEMAEEKDLSDKIENLDIELTKLDLEESIQKLKESNQIVSEYVTAKDQYNKIEEIYQQCQKALDMFKTSFESEDVEKVNECKDTYNTIKDCLKKMLGDNYEVPKWNKLTQEEEKIRKDMGAKLEEVKKNYNEKETKLKEAPAQLEQYLNRLAQRTQGLEKKVQPPETGTVASTPAQAESTPQYQSTQQPTQQPQAQETTKTLETVAETKTPQQPQAQAPTSAQEISNISDYTVKLGRGAVFTPYFVVRNEISGKEYKIPIGKSGELRLPQDVVPEVGAAIKDFAEKNKSDVIKYVQSFYGKKVELKLS